MPRTQTLTPVESSDDESEDELPAPITPSYQTCRSPVDPFQKPSIPRDDDDMDMTDSQPRIPSPPPWQQKTSSFSTSSSIRMRSPPRPSAISTGRSNFFSSTYNPADSTGRLPTPIYGHFNPTSIPASSSLLGVHQNPAVARTIRSSGPISPIPGSPLSPSDQAEAAWWQRGRLPSPAEDEDGDSEMVPSSPSMGMLVDSMLPKLNVSPPSQPGSISGEMELSVSAPTRFASDDGCGRMPRSPTSFGRARSNATSSPTFPPNCNSTNPGVSRLSMGFRADCEKCIKRVPGHYTHILRD